MSAMLMLKIKSLFPESARKPPWTVEVGLADLRPACAQRRSDGDLLAPLRNPVGRNPGESDGGQRQAERVRRLSSAARQFVPLAARATAMKIHVPKALECGSSSYRLSTAFGSAEYRTGIA